MHCGGAILVTHTQHKVPLVFGLCAERQLKRAAYLLAETIGPFIILHFFISFFILIDHSFTTPPLSLILHHLSPPTNLTLNHHLYTNCMCMNVLPVLTPNLCLLIRCLALRQYIQFHHATAGFVEPDSLIPLFCRLGSDVRLCHR